MGGFIKEIYNNFSFIQNKDLFFFILIYLAYIGYTDFKERRIPNFANYSMIALRFILHLSNTFPIRLTDIIGSVVFFLLFFAVAYYKNIRMGGDIKAVFVVGLYFGIAGSVAINILAVFFGATYFLTRILRGQKVTQDVNAPYGFFLFLSTAILGLAYYNLA